MLDDRHIKAIELIITGEHSMTDIAKEVGIARNTLYSWNDNVEYKAEMDKRLLQIRTNARKGFDAKLGKALDLYWQLASDPTVEARVRQVALSNWIDRSLGKVSSNINVSATTTVPNVEEQDLLSELEEVNNQIELEESEYEVSD